MNNAALTILTKMEQQYIALARQVADLRRDVSDVHFDISAVMGALRDKDYQWAAETLERIAAKLQSPIL